MPHLLPAAAGFFAAHPVLLFASRVATSALLSLVSGKLFGPKSPRAAGLRGLQVTTRSAIEFRKVVYGQAAVSGPIVYQNLSGTNNSELWYVIALASHECEDLVEVLIDDQTVPKADISWTAGTGGSDGTGTGAVSTSVFVGDNSTNGLYIYYYLGDAAQPVPGDLDTAFADVDSNFRGRGVTHIVLQASYVEDTATVWEGGPPQNIRVVLKGRKIYDPRLDSTNGGSGSHRYTDSTTWEWSENPALCVADYLVNYMNAAPATAINWTSVADAADDCEVSAAIPTASTEDRFTCNGALSLGATHKDNLDALLSSMDGKLSYVGGQWTVRASVWETADFAIVEDDLAGTVTVQGSAARRDRFNTVTGIFVDPARNYQTTEFQHVTDSGFKTRDNNVTLKRDLTLPFTNSEYMAQRIAYRVLEQGDNQIVAQVPLNYRGLKIAVGDTGTVTIDHLGWSAKSFRCINWKMQGDGTFIVTLREDQSASYDDPIEGDYDASSTGGNTLPTVTVPPPSNLAATATSAGISLSWTNPADPLFDRIDIYESSSSAWGGASLVGSVKGSRFDLTYSSAVTRYFWVRAVKDGRESLRDPNSDTSTVSATAGIDDDFGVGDLPGSIEVIDLNLDTTNAAAYIRITSAGDIESSNAGTTPSYTSDGTYIESGQANTDYEVYFSDVVQGNDTPSGASVNAWLDPSTTRTWDLTQSGSAGTKQGEFQMKIRRTSDNSILATIDVLLYAERQ